MAESAFSDPPKRPPGRPKGLPKTGGRRKGVNRHAPELRAFIDQRGRPLEFLAAITSCRKLTAADPADPTKTIRMYPSLEARAAAARALLNKLLPDLRQAAHATEIEAGGGPHLSGHRPENAPGARILWKREFRRREEPP